MDFTGECYQTSKEELTAILKCFPKKRDGNTSKLILKPGEDDTHTQKNYRPLPLMNMDFKNLSTLLASHIQLHIRIICHSQVRLSPRIQR